MEEYEVTVNTEPGISLSEAREIAKKKLETKLNTTRVREGDAP